MKITNNYNLPQAVVELARAPSYSKGKAHLSVTEMMGSPKISILRRKHDNEIEVDASTMLYSLFGTAFHKMMEAYVGPNDILEERLYAEFDGWHISGAIDKQTFTADGIEIRDWGAYDQAVEAGAHGRLQRDHSGAHGQSGLVASHQ